MAWTEKRGSKYVIYDRNGNGKKFRVATAYTDKQASQQMLARYVRDKARGAEGLIDPFEKHKHRPLTEHVKDYIADLTALGRDSKYINNCDRRLAKLIAACGWKVLADITADSFCHWRETLPRLKDGRPKIGPRSQNQYLEAARAFCGWCVKPRKRIAANPLSDVPKVDGTGDVRRARRALTAEEVTALLNAASKTHQEVYQFILATGLRRQELVDLVWGDLRLDAPRPFIQLQAANTKARRADTLPLRSHIVEALRARRGEAGDGDKVFTDIPSIEQHRAYLEVAGIPWLDEQTRRADFHSIRHTYGTMLSQSGVSPREAMELMRHTDMRLTMKVYTDPRLFDLASAVERLPIPAASVPGVAVATGTDGKPACQNPAESRGAQRGASSAIQGHSTAVIGQAPSDAGRSETPANTGDCRPLTPNSSDGRGSKKNSAGRTRTYNQPVNSRLLYH